MGKQKAAIFPIRVIFAFIAGSCSVLIFHQATLSILHAVGIAAATPFPYGPTKPFGLPQIWSLAFWGGIWGIAFALAEGNFPGGAGYWLLTLIFGAIGPTFVAWFVVFPLKGIPLGGGWKPSGIITGLMINAAWGIGTAMILQGLSAWWTQRRHKLPQVDDAFQSFNSLLLLSVFLYIGGLILHFDKLSVLNLSKEVTLLAAI